MLGAVFSGPGSLFWLLILVLGAGLGFTPSVEVLTPRLGLLGMDGLAAIDGLRAGVGLEDAWGDEGGEETTTSSDFVCVFFFPTSTVSSSSKLSSILSDKKQLLINVNRTNIHCFI